MREDTDSYVVEADVPGVDPKEIEITTENGALVIKGARNVIEGESADGFKRTERVRGSFLRRFNLPEGVDESAIEATSENGVLRVKIPKQEKTEPRRIPVA